MSSAEASAGLSSSLSAIKANLRCRSTTEPESPASSLRPGTSSSLQSFSQTPPDPHRSSVSDIQTSTSPSPSVVFTFLSFYVSISLCFRRSDSVCVCVRGGGETPAVGSSFMTKGLGATCASSFCAVNVFSAQTLVLFEHVHR